MKDCDHYFQEMFDRSQYYRDMAEGELTVNEATETLAKKMPAEMIATVLLNEVLFRLEKFRDPEQWGVVKSSLLNLQWNFIDKAERLWSNEIDEDKVQELYDKRYG